LKTRAFKVDPFRFAKGMELIMHSIKQSILFAGMFALVGCAAETYSEAEGDLDQTAVQEEALASGRRIVVDLAADSTTGVCRIQGTSRGQCNLRAALLTASQASGSIVIELAVNPIVSEGQIAVTGKEITIQPRSGRASRSITGSSNSRLFSVSENTYLKLNNLVISNFKVFDFGGAIASSGKLELNNTTFKDNSATCFGTGAMTAFATCGGGAISSTGALFVRPGTRFENNSVNATASTASFTNASAGGGAIASSGRLEMRPPFAFVGNVSSATAQSGVHGNVPNSASASSGGGAISNSGTLNIKAAPAGSCVFTNNAAPAVANSASGSDFASSEGGAIWTSTAITGAEACVFTGNSATVDPDVHFEPAP
jgi:hypothetical protein